MDHTNGLRFRKTQDSLKKDAGRSQQSSETWSKMRIPDPLEIKESSMDHLLDKYVDDHTCMECGKSYDYDMVCPDPLGYGPLICYECLGFNPFDKDNK